MTSLLDAVRALLEDPAEGHLDRKLARAILGTDDAVAIAARVEAYAREAFGRSVASCRFFTQSVGAVWGLELEGGDRVVVKAHALADGGLRGFASIEPLAAAYAAQAAMAERGVPCARVLVPPRAWDRGAVAAMSFLDAPRGDDPHLPAVRRAMAEAMASMVEIGHSLAHLPLPRAPAPKDALYPAPHNALFDLSVPGGEWIDARARAARAALEGVPERLVPMHTDVSAANVRVAGGRVVAVFDMDSVAFADEASVLANVAVHFTYRGEPPWTWPTRDEARAFVAEYERARGRPFDREERRALSAWAIAKMAYTARCEHGLHPNGGDERMRALLRAAPDDYFS